MRARAGALVDAVAMVLVGAAIWFFWNPLMDYMPFRFADDVDKVIGWFGDAPETSSRAGLFWLGDIKWLVGALIVVLLFWLVEKLIAIIRTRVLGEH